MIVRRERVQIELWEEHRELWYERRSIRRTGGCAQDPENAKARSDDTTSRGGIVTGCTSALCTRLALSAAFPYLYVIILLYTLV